MGDVRGPTLLLLQQTLQAAKAHEEQHRDSCHQLQLALKQKDRNAQQATQAMELPDVAAIEFGCCKMRPRRPS